MLNADLEQSGLMADIAGDLAGQVVGFGRTSKDYKLLDVTVENGVTHAHARVADQDLRFSIQSAGQHFAMNGLGALAAVAALGARS